MKMKKRNVWKRLLVMLLCVAMVAPYLPVLGTAADDPAAQITSVLKNGVTDYGTSDPLRWTNRMVDGLFANKYVSASDANGNYTLTLDAYATGSQISIPNTTPADIVLVLDQSSSMYTPVGVDADRIFADFSKNSSTVQTQLNEVAISGSTFRNTAYAEHSKLAEDSSYTSEFLENAKHLGYYVARHPSYSYLYIVQLAQDGNGLWNWYYYCCEDTTKSVSINPSAPVYASNYGATVVLDKQYTWDFEGTANDIGFTPMDGLIYYKSQYGALYDTLKDFVSDLHTTAQETGVDHNVAIVGFASPFYDGWDNYDGTGAYIDGQYFLFDNNYAYWNDANGNGYLDEGETIYDPDEEFGGQAGDGVITAAEINSYSYLAGNYDKVLANVRTEEGYQSLLNSIEAYSANYQQTCPSIGITIAEAIFAARDDKEKGEVTSIYQPKPTIESYAASFATDPGKISVVDQDDEHSIIVNAKVDADGNILLGEDGKAVKTEGYSDNMENRDEIIILFSDGTPTVRCTSDRHEHGQSGNQFAENEFWSIAGGYDDAIDHAKHAKGAGITVYTVGTSKSLFGSSDTIEVQGGYTAGLLGLMSSDCPKSYSLFTINETWTQDSAGNYYLSATSYKTYSHPGTNFNVDLKYTSYASDSGFDLAVAFKTIYNSIVDTVDLDDTAVLKEIVSDYFDLANATVAGIKTYTADYLGTDAGGTHQFSTIWNPITLDVSLSASQGDERLDTVNVSGFNYMAEYVGTDAGGNAHGKKLIIQLLVKVREGFWGGNNVPTNETSTAIYSASNDVAIYFPVPEVNVPVQPVLDATDKTVYYGGTVTSGELLTTLQVGGLDVTLSEGALIPAQSWMDDYATLVWNKDSTVAGITEISGKQADSYRYAVTLSPIFSGLTNRSDRPSNLVGTPVSAISVGDTANVYVLEPVITYHDTAITVGDKLDSDYYLTNDFVELVWVDQITRTNPVLAPVDAAPSLTYGYDPLGYLLADTPVNVTVTSSYSDEDITGIVTFQWATCDAHGTNSPIQTHLGSEDSPEFYVHVTYILLPDAVVIDFGLSVNIDVLSNDDPNGGALKLVGFTATAPDLTQGFEYQAELASKYGTMSVNGSSASYAVGTTAMNGQEKLYYAVEFTTASGDVIYLTAPVSVIPATSIYYEDSFLTFEPSSEATDQFGAWTTDGTAYEATQAQDRLDAIDANNIYGFDPAYKNFQTFSLGSAQKVTVDMASGSASAAPTASFSFTGTGFDVISLTDSTSGCITVTVTDTDGKVVANYIVSNYYGYKYENDQWILDNTNTDCLYQVPVIKVDGLAYGKYDVVIKAAYVPFLNQTASEDSYSIWIDAVRIYNPAAEDNDIHDIYVQANEQNPVYGTIKDLLLTQENFTAGSTVTGVVFMDGKGQTGVTVTDYANQGPNNEVYLKEGNGIAFKLVSKTESAPLAVHIGAKLASGNTATLSSNKAEPVTLATATNMYYALSGVTWTKNGDNWESDVIVLSCGETDGILSLTDVKITAADAITVSTSVGELPEVLLAQSAQPMIVMMADAEVIETGIHILQGEPEIPTPPAVDPGDSPEEIPETRDVDLVWFAAVIMLLSLLALAALPFARKK